MWKIFLEGKKKKKKEKEIIQNGMHTVYIPENLHAGSTEVSFSCQ